MVGILDLRQPSWQLALSSDLGSRYKSCSDGYATHREWFLHLSRMSSQHSGSVNDTRCMLALAFQTTSSTTDSVDFTATTLKFARRA